MSKRAREYEEEGARRREQFLRSTFVPASAAAARQSLYELTPIKTIASIRARLPTIENGIRVSESHIPGAGRGLFALQGYANGDLITFYDGEIIHWRSALPAEFQTHARQLEFHTYTILGNYPPYNNPRLGFGGGAFINDGLHTYVSNAEFVHIDSVEYVRTHSPFERIIAVRALRAIAQGEEIYVSYGGDYWRAATREAATREVAAITEADLLREDAWRQAERVAVETQAKRRRIIPTPISEVCDLCSNANAAWVDMEGAAAGPAFYCAPCAALLR